VTLADFDNPVLNPFVFLHPKTLKIILITSVPDTKYFRNASCALCYISTFYCLRYISVISCFNHKQWWSHTNEARSRIVLLDHNWM